MIYKAKDIAQFVVNYAAEKNKNVTNLKLQKMLYFLHSFVFTIHQSAAPLAASLSVFL
ncbi:hypothetical protein [Treponema phagedenis]|uniref:hypothetical protein n=1 Tax=Treponema phagedenis TaxID=162 RepID=UPI00197E44D9|nr:hypothetical protein [Treponema phagedenis]